MAGAELPLLGRQLPLAVPLADQGQGDLLDLLVHERLSDVEQLVQQLHVVDDLGQRLVGVGGHDHDLDVTVERAHPADRLDAVDAGRHPDVDVGDGDGAVRFPSRADERARLLAGAGVQQLELRQKRRLLLVDERRRQIIGRGRLRVRGAQHLFEVVVDLMLIVDHQDPVVGVPYRRRRAGHASGTGGTTEDSGSMTRMVVPWPGPWLSGSMRPPEAITKLAAEWRPSPLPDGLVV